MCGHDPCANAAAQAAAAAAVGANTNALVASVVLGGTMVAFWLNVLWSMASQLYWEKEIGNLQLYMMAPMNRMAARRHGRRRHGHDVDAGGLDPHRRHLRLRRVI